MSIGETRVPAVGRSEVERCVHVVQFYSDDKFLVGSLATAICVALREGDSAIAIATESHRNQLDERLIEVGIDVAKERECGRYITVDASETLQKIMDGKSPDPVRFAAVAGALIDRAAGAATIDRAPGVAAGELRRVLAYGEMVAVLWERGNRDAAIALESLWNDLAKTRAFELRCAYPMKGFDHSEDAEQFRMICAHHSAVIPDESYMELTSEEDRLRNISDLQQRAWSLNAETAKRGSMAEEIEARKRAQAELAEFSSQLMHTQDDERHHVARQLHEAISQDLVALQISLQMIEAQPGSAKHRKFLKDARETVVRCIRELRSLTYILHPPLLDDVGLASAISWYAGCFSERSGIKVGLDLPATNLRLPKRNELALFRVFQEAMTNFESHAETTGVTVRLQVARDSATLEVGAPDVLLGEPGGDGPVADGGWRPKPMALMGLRQRLAELGGRLEVWSDGSGTHLRAVTPLELLN